MDLPQIAAPSPVFIWGAISRGLGLVFLISFSSLAVQVVRIAGRNGVVPLADTLRAIERDFTPWKRFLYFPTLLWLDRSDGMLKALCWAGIAASASIVAGGPHVPWAFAVCYVLYLSLDRAMYLVFPWDSMLFEAGFWGVFLPATAPFPHLQAVATPLPAVAWVYRLLVFRVIFGFGKHKFIGATRQDFGFLKGFMVNQPLPTPLGWFARHLPLWSFKLALIAMFVVELPLPVAVFAPGMGSTVAAVAIILLMIGIQLTGNFGYFNVAMVVLALSWCDNDTAVRFSFADFFPPHGPVNVYRLVLLHTLLALAAFPFNTFCALTWVMWSPILRVRPRPLMWILDVVRFFHPFRIAHAYGVFPPQSPPPIRVSPVTEVTWDGRTWYPLTHRHWQTTETSPPTFCAPHHNRFDQAVVYEGLGLNEMSLYRNIIGRWDPYGHAGISAPKAMLRKLLQGTLHSSFFAFESKPDDGPPIAVRVRTYMLEPTTLAERRQTGKWWTKTLIGPHFPPMRLEDGYFDAANAPPELWHFEDLIWLKRSKVGGLMARAARGENPHGLVMAATSDLSVEDVETFWTEIVPGPIARHRSDWRGIRATVAEMRATYGFARVHRFERIAGRYGALLFAKLEPLFLDRGILPVFGRVRASLDVKSYFHLRLLALHIVAMGRDAYDAVIRDPSSAASYSETLSMPSSAVFQALFRYEDLVYQSQKLRLLDAFTQFDGRKPPTAARAREKEKQTELLHRLFGALELIEFVKTQFRDPEDVLDVRENLPRFVILESTEVVRASNTVDTPGQWAAPTTGAPP